MLFLSPNGLMVCSSLLRLAFVYAGTEVWASTLLKGGRGSE